MIEWLRLIIERKKFVACCDLFEITLLCVNMKNYKNIACADFVIVIITLKLHSYEEN